VKDGIEGVIRDRDNESRLEPVNYRKEKKAAVENIFKLFGLVPLCDSGCHLVFVSIVILNQKPVFNVPPSYELNPSRHRLLHFPSFSK